MKTATDLKIFRTDAGWFVEYKVNGVLHASFIASVTEQQYVSMLQHKAPEVIRDAGFHTSEELPDFNEIITELAKPRL